MKTLSSRIAIVVVLMLLVPLSLYAQPNPEAEATYKEIKKRFGFVPSFVKAFPEVGIAAAWDELVALDFNPNTALPAKTKALIGLAVSAQIPCRYCVYFDTQSAKLAGATDVELKEAVAMAAVTYHWSTVLNGLQIDETEFKKEMGRVFAYAAKPPARTDAPLAVVDAPTAYKDIERTFGMVPTFLRAFPEVGISAAWRLMKTVQLNPDTALTPKTKELIGLAVSAQIPCKYCIHFHTIAARNNGASDNEIKEAVAMAALSREWSTVLNGSTIDEATFRKEVDMIVKEAKKQSKQAAR